MIKILKFFGAALATGAVCAASSNLGDGSFSLVLGDGRVVKSTDLKPSVVDASHQRFTGVDPEIEATETLPLPSADKSYTRTIVEVKNTGKENLSLTRIVLLDAPAPKGTHVVGRFTGSPIIFGNTFCGVEHPLAENRIATGRVQCALPVTFALRPGETITASLVVGTCTESSQLRRTFLDYIEKERIRPYAPFLHHNTWYNLGYFAPFSEKDELNLISNFGGELVEKRGVKLDGFVLDDGWDDTHTLWHFSSAWPEGLKNMKAAAAKFGAAPGIWLSPWGGYGPPRKARLSAATPEGFEIRDGKFSLAGPRYYERFRELCKGVVRNDGVVYFKFDGIGADAAGEIDPASRRDFDAMLRLIHELRSLRHDLYISQTTGTWPSPWWLFQVDNIWRGGEDHSFTGVGTNRQRWITYRDAQTYEHVVRVGPLFPLNSLMIHGIIYAKHAKNLNSDPGDDFRSEVRSYFGTGTQLQELYLSPELLTAKNWDDLAAAAKWARSNTATLRDTHWVGGDPEKLETYGWAAWSPEKGVLTLRNPSDKPASFTLDAQKLFELPARAPRAFAIAGAYADTPAPIAQLRVGEPAEITLQPFEVLVLVATPRS